MTSEYTVHTPARDHWQCVCLPFLMKLVEESRMLCIRNSNSCNYIYSGQTVRRQRQSYIQFSRGCYILSNRQTFKVNNEELTFRTSAFIQICWKNIIPCIKDIYHNFIDMTNLV